MKIASALIAVIVIVILMAVEEYRHSGHKQPPPGWTIVQDQEGYYGVRWPSGLSVIEYDGKRRMKSRQQAIDRAWRQYEFDLEEKSRKWEPVK